MKRKQRKSLLWRRFGFVILITIKFGDQLLWISPRIINGLKSYIEHSEECFIRYPNPVRRWLKNDRTLFRVFDILHTKWSFLYFTSIYHFLFKVHWRHTSTPTAYQLIMPCMYIVMWKVCLKYRMFPCLVAACHLVFPILSILDPFAITSSKQPPLVKYNNGQFENREYSLSSNRELTCMQIPKTYTFQYA